MTSSANLDRWDYEELPPMIQSWKRAQIPRSSMGALDASQTSVPTELVVRPRNPCPLWAWLMAMTAATICGFSTLLHGPQAGVAGDIGTLMHPQCVLRDRCRLPLCPVTAQRADPCSGNKVVLPTFIYHGLKLTSARLDASTPLRVYTAKDPNMCINHPGVSPDSARGMLSASFQSPLSGTVLIPVVQILKLGRRDPPSRESRGVLERLNQFTE